jgi:LacI family transcriptional regulator/LacI family repressor for deo operon, udp, cdd, tsx, nupC, and nupG
MDVDTVSVNNENGAYQSIQQLIKLGHERIGIINGIRGLSTTTRRFEGYKRALKEANIPLDEELIIYEDSKQGGGKAGTRKLLNLENPPTAVFSTNNLMSLGFFEEVYSQNLKIPEDISLIGFDDMSWATALNPPLTAVRQPARELGMTATELLLKRLNEPYRKSLNIVLNPELIMRKSCECITKKV